MDRASVEIGGKLEAWGNSVCRKNVKGKKEDRTGTGPTEVTRSMAGFSRSGEGTRTCQR
jgi:hypothetical protein